MLFSKPVMINSNTIFLNFCFIYVNKEYQAYRSLCLKEEIISRKKILRIKAIHAYLIQFSPAEKLPPSSHRSLFPHFFRSSF